ncbi:MAG: inositol monophosphatase family protein [Cyanobacteria bacterium P01_F01_bin.150]
MTQSPTPRQIIEAVLPSLEKAAGYSQSIQANIALQPDKDLYPGNFFASALTDADLSIQTMIEVSLLGSFPDIRFYGEEYEGSYNTKYFRSLELGPDGDYLVVLDPIDGTRYYADGHDNYQIILAVLNHDWFEAAIVVSPAHGVYTYAFRGQGTYRGKIGQSLDACEKLVIPEAPNRIFLGWSMGELGLKLGDRYDILNIQTDYSTEVQVPNMLQILDGAFQGVVLRRGKFIDGGAIAFLAQEAGLTITTLDNKPMPPLHTCKDYAWPALIMARSEHVHQDMLRAIAAP